MHGTFFTVQKKPRQNRVFLPKIALKSYISYRNKKRNPLSPKCSTFELLCPLQLSGLYQRTSAYTHTTHAATHIYTQDTPHAIQTGTNMHTLQTVATHRHIVCRHIAVRRHEFNLSTCVGAGGRCISDDNRREGGHIGWTRARACVSCVILSVDQAVCFEMWLWFIHASR